MSDHLAVAIGAALSAAGFFLNMTIFKRIEKLEARADRDFAVHRHAVSNVEQKILALWHELKEAQAEGHKAVAHTDTTVAGIAGRLDEHSRMLTRIYESLNRLERGPL